MFSVISAALRPIPLISASERRHSVDLNFERIMNDLTSISVRLGHYAFIYKAHMKMPDLLDHINDDMLAKEAESESFHSRNLPQ